MSLEASPGVQNAQKIHRSEKTRSSPLLDRQNRSEARQVGRKEEKKETPRLPSHEVSACLLHAGDHGHVRLDIRASSVLRMQVG